VIKEKFMLPLPNTGRTREEVLQEMRAARDTDVKWHQGRAFGLVYHISDEIDTLLKDAFTLFFSENGLNPTAFPSLRRFETEVVAMTAALLGGDENVVGTMTSGGTESDLMAVKTARDWARSHQPHIQEPELVMPVTGHPAFDKAGDYFGVRVIHVPVRDDYRADVDAMRAAITPNTIMMAASAPAYPHGVVDPIRDLAATAQEHGLLFHVDACVGGFMLPFVRKLGYPVPDFDFSVPGVTSISADLHKFGYAAKPASVVLYRTPELRRQQFFVYIDWPGGIYPSTAMTGTRPGGPVAAAWALMNYLGEQGYLHITETVMQATRKIQEGIRDIPGINVLSDPEMSVFAIGSDGVNIYELADELARRGWHFDRQHYPASLHVTVNYVHAAIADTFLADLADAVAAVRRPGLRKSLDRALVKGANAAVRRLPEEWTSRLMDRISSLLGGSGGIPERTAPIYGLIGTLPNRGDIRQLVLDLIDGLFRYQEPH
jgi:sphinganine-1-phosphate aldolase